MTLDAEVETFCRLVRARSEEHRRAVQVLADASLSGQIVAVLRQELDSMVRVIFLLAQTDRQYRQELIRASLNGARWKHQNKKMITDAEMVALAQTLHGWTQSVYKFGCAFIHLSRNHDYLARDPLLALADDERTTIIGYLRTYHFAPETDDAGFVDIVPLLPRVFEKIAANLDCCLRELETWATTQPDGAGAG